MMNLKKIFSVGLVGLAALGLAACGGSSSKESKSADGPVTVKVGVMSLSDTEEARWNKVQEILDKENAGIKLEYTQFTDYSQPNQALLDGDVQYWIFLQFFLLLWD